MDVDKLIQKLIRVSKPDGDPILVLNNYLWIAIVTIGLIVGSEIYKNQSLRLLSHISGCFFIQFAFLFFFSMTLNVLRKEEDMKCLDLWKKVLLLSISLVPICGLAFIQITLLRKILDF
jgi:hypothetical protein